MDTRPFFFKQFGLHHHRSTQKLCTDSILFSRWVEVTADDDVLDIGTGCGIIPMMLAQKGIHNADAVEIDHDSCEEAKENFEGCPWKERLRVFEDDIRTFAIKSEKRYDLIVSNPPYFTESRPINTRKKLARHTDSLSYDELLDASSLLLKPCGRLALVLPSKESLSFIEKAEKHGFHLQKIQKIIPIEGKEPNRVNMQFSKHCSDVVTQSFTIRCKDYSFTQEYKEYLKDYYLDL